MIKEGSQIASVNVTLPVTEFLSEMFSCPNRKQVFSPPKLTAKHKLNGPAGPKDGTHESFE